MIRKLLLPLALILASCTQLTEPQQPPQPHIQSRAAQKGPGEIVLDHLYDRLEDLRDNCGAPSQPAFLCNGIILRGTRYSPSYHSWDNSNNNHTKGAVSFSYLRKDAKFEKLAYSYTNGYIFLPVFYAGGKLQPEVLCSFPIDAGSENRVGTGCGATPGYAGSGPCQEQGITTASAWYSHYLSSADRHAHQCGFDTRDALNESATQGFVATLQAMKLMGDESYHTQNELRLRVWPDGQGANLPLEAFFYVHNLTGRADAMADQRDLYNTTGRAIPVIELWLPDTNWRIPAFDYHPADQAVPLN